MYIPICHESLYYLYDCMNRELYPCSQKTYDIFQTDMLCTSNKQRLNIDSKVATELNNNSKTKRSLYNFPTVSRDMVLHSLSRVPQIILELTEKCNLNCVYCCYGKLYRSDLTNQNEKKEDILNYLRTLLELKKQYNIKSDLLISFYGGEPLLRFDIITACVELSREILPDVRIKYGMTTNGLLLHKHIEYLVSYNFSLVVSIDGNKENNQYRIDTNGKESFSRVNNNIEEICCKYPTFFKENVSFSTVLHNKNNYIDSMLFFSKWNKRPIFSSVSTLNAKDRKDELFQEITKQHVYSKSELNLLKSSYPETYKLLFNQGATNNISSWPEGNKLDNHIEIMDKEKFVYPGNFCFLFPGRVFVTVGGHLLTCEKVSRKFKFGKIRNNTLSIYTKRINKYYDRFKLLFQTKCSKCYKNSYAQHVFLQKKRR